MAVGLPIQIGVVQTKMGLNLGHVSAMTLRQLMVGCPACLTPTQQLQWSMEYYKKLTLGPVHLRNVS